MAAKGISSVKSRKISRGFAAALASAFLEWLLIFMLYVDAIFSYLVTNFARCCNLQVPCLLCSRLDHVLGNEKQGYYRNLICGAHKLEISSLVLCHAHNELVDVHGMCESCLFSFATINKSNAETYRLLVGKLGEDPAIGNDDPVLEGHNHGAPSTRHCSCCKRPWIPSQKLFQTRSIGRETAEVDLPLSGSVEHVQNEHKKRMDRATGSFKMANNGDDLLSYVGYTELKISSDTESEVLISEDDEAHSLVRGTNGPKNDFVVRHEDSETRIITLTSDDFDSEKLIHQTSQPEPSLIMSTVRPDVKTSHDGTLAWVIGHGLEELKWQHIEDKVNHTQSELISFDDVLSIPEITENFVPAVNDNFEATVPVEVGQIYIQEFEEVTEAKSHPTIVTAMDLEEKSDAGLQMPVEAGQTSIAEFDEVTEEKSQPTAITGLALDKKINPGPQITVEAGKKSIAEEKSQLMTTTGMGLAKKSDTEAEMPVEAGRTSMVEVAQEKSHPITTLMGLEKKSDAGAQMPAEVGQTSIAEFDEVPEEKSQPTTVAGLGLEKKNDSELQRPVEGRQTSVAEFEEVTEEICQPTTIAGMDLEKRSDPELQRPLEGGQTSIAEFRQVTEEICQPTTTTGMGLDMKSESGPLMHGDLDLGDAYKIAIGIKGRQLSDLSGEQRTMSNSTRVSEDLKLLLSQLSRGVEFPSFDISPRVSRNSEELKTPDAADVGMHMLQKRMTLERNESGLSLDGSLVSEIEGESVIDRLKRQIEHDKKLLSSLYKELEEERNASAIAANQAMAMITKLQEEKASLHMDASQYLRMMEEQAEYDMEALQRANDDLVEKEKEIQDLEAELEYYRMKYPDEHMLENMVEPISGLKERDIRIDFLEATSIKDRSFSPNQVTEPITLPYKVEEISTLSGDKHSTPRSSFSKSEGDRFSKPLSPEKLAEKLHQYSGNGVRSAYANGEFSGDDEGGNLYLKEPNEKGNSQETSNTKENELSKQDDTSEPEISSSTHERKDLPSDTSESVCRETYTVVSGKEISNSDGNAESLQAEHTPIQHTINLHKHEHAGLPEKTESDGDN